MLLFQTCSYIPKPAPVAFPLIDSNLVYFIPQVN